MDFLYNPDCMSEAELTATFVGRENLLRDLLDIIRSQPEGAGVQHTIIIAPRGMGKTATLQRLRYAVMACELGRLWLPVKYPEENYGVIDLADFWLETLRILGAEHGDKKLLEQSQALPRQFQNRADIADAALSALKNYSRCCGKRLLLLIENMDELLGLIANGTDAGKLRDSLMNEGTFMIAGSGVRFFRQARNYDQPLYNFFQIFDLNQLSFEQARELLLKRAEQEGSTQLHEQLQTHTARLQALHYFTQGVPRLVLMLYRILAQSDLHAVQQALEKLLDEITPYYKARIEVLPPQERKLLDHIARAAAQTHEGASPTALAKAMHLPPNHVGTLLKRLVDAGYLRSVPLKGRKACYVLSEPLYSLWHQMRLNPETRNKKLIWLVEFLHDWFDDQQRVTQAKQLFSEFEKYQQAGDHKRTRSVVEQMVLLGQSAMSTAVVGETMPLEAMVYGRFEEACNAYNHALAINPHHLLDKNKLGQQIIKIEDDFRYAVIQNEWEAAQIYWQSMVLVKDTITDKNMPKRSILFAAEFGYLSFAKEILIAAQLEEQLFPLARALDYLQTHDEELLSILAPEIVGAVKLVIQDLQTAIAQNKAAQEAGNTLLQTK